MKCDRCGSTKQVVDAVRKYDEHNRRVKQCVDCGDIWATVEVREDKYGGPGEVEKYVKSVLVTRGDA